MTAPDLPAEGGTYLRHADGRLERLEDRAPDAPAVVETPAKPAVKSPVKEA